MVILKIKNLEVLRVGDKVRVVKVNMGDNYGGGNDGNYQKGYTGRITRIGEVSGTYKGHRWVELDTKRSGIIEGLLEKV